MKIFRCIIMLEKITVETIDSLAFLPEKMSFGY